MTIKNFTVFSFFAISLLLLTFSVCAADDLSDWLKGILRPPTADEQYRQGWKYYEGTDVPKDQEKAAAYFRQAAKRKHVAAQTMLGYCYHLGTGVEKNLTEAAKWYRKAAEQGHRQAVELLQQIETKE
jgi:TPR repeat protein